MSDFNDYDWSDAERDWQDEQDLIDNNEPDGE